MLLKQRLPVAEIEAQAAFELPKRDMLQLVTVVITDLLNNVVVNVPITVTVARNNIAVQVCAVVQALNTILLPGQTLTCDITQRQ